MAESNRPKHPHKLNRLEVSALRVFAVTQAGGLLLSALGVGLLLLLAAWLVIAMTGTRPGPAWFSALDTYVGKFWPVFLAMWIACLWVGCVAGLQRVGAIKLTRKAWRILDDFTYRNREAGTSLGFLFTGVAIVMALVGYMGTQGEAGALSTLLLNFGLAVGTSIAGQVVQLTGFFVEGLIPDDETQGG
ncbi:hypothetical protein [Magnetospirillum sulfuroxidans]|uniref:MotA/TolQ/ExbB proton channel domain-containing protein n=1 Tax=Magnetospirillum sulfuroxidans TaxID=611300 RepID=A0ABS5IER3_9PROT|nr:hypothetical protein [Magnetospirillum sulfuroxidans]MBR9972906.1 hypothetical protein [Magnetospirillum sulfuroxidans]